MTTFTGPVNVKVLNAETTTIELHEGGSARFTDMVRASGGGQFGGTVSAAGDIFVSGNVRAAGGKVVYEQSVTVWEGATAGVTAAVIPAGGSIVGMTMFMKNTFPASAGATVTLNVGDSADADVYGTLTNVSSTAIFHAGQLTGCCARALSDLAAETNVIFKTIAASGTVSGGLNGASGAGNYIATVLYRKA